MTSTRTSSKLTLPLLAISILASLLCQFSQAADATRVYIGAYTQDGGRGINQASFDPNTGELKLLGLAGEAKNPSFLALPANDEFLYSVNEIGDYNASRGGTLSAFAVDAESGQLSLLNNESTAGTGPCFVSLDNEGKHALVANYGNGSVAVLPIDAAGKLQPASAVIQQEGTGPNAARQTGPHAHSIKLDAANRFALACDLGADKVFVYRFDPTKGTLTPNETPWFQTAPGAGPRHLAFHPNGKWVYIVNELDCTLVAAAYDAERGVLKALQTETTLPAGGVEGNTCAEVVVHPTGKFVYASNRGHDSIAMFAIDEATGKLTPLGQHPAGGKTPRNFNIDPSGKFLLAALQGSNRVVVHTIDQATGKLTQTDHAIETPMPVCIKFVP